MVVAAAGGIGAVEQTVLEWGKTAAEQTADAVGRTDLPCADCAERNDVCAMVVAVDAIANWPGLKDVAVNVLGVVLQRVVLHFRSLTLKSDGLAGAYLQRRKKFEFHCCCDIFPSLD